ncbi:hypothetical protein SODALDRAFT_323737 [Sodiomyces alkalinus F11]|uniref:Autophagy protein n=1 Tax=Sodiomyces alkalinus (strain CBS 110278 / VKM F-3762 / F11) TaxID=1314773 RepID=A0A3N2PXW7_SODAK|nr:hypothetical protein SODALDRAFT_323737 [Sodiomyces alkalinus F11]ROT39337.1 hypothetical protein SODALDRAFT_323737 [Sodiomyces alkalinus F11]
MGWLDGWWSDSTKSSDPLASVDPKLREFLKRESPVKYHTPTTQDPAPSRTAPSSSNASTGEPADKPLVPRESLFQDGRYAHLWKNYKSLGDVEAETKTDHEKLMDVLDGYKERKHTIGKAALENCAIQQEEWISCMKSGAWEDRLQMCRKQVQRFEKCYTTQTRLLKALGYGSVVGRPPEVEEDIQMHADALYLRVLEQERALKDAKDQGRPLSDLQTLFPKPEGANAIEPGAELRKSWEEKLQSLPPEERASEEAALRADFQAKAVVARDVQKLWEAQADERKAREAEGKTTMLDRFSSLFRFK